MVDDLFDFGLYAGKIICKDLTEADEQINIDNILKEIDENWQPYMWKNDYENFNKQNRA